MAEGLAAIGPNNVSVPEYFFKVILDYSAQDYKAIGFVLPHRVSKAPLRQYAMAVDEVEALTGYDFYPDLEDNLENRLEATADFGVWPQVESVSASRKANYDAWTTKDVIEAGSIVVYITPSGKKYHTATCRYVKNKKQAIGHGCAKQAGYDPCKVCRPGR